MTNGSEDKLPETSSGIIESSGPLNAAIKSARQFASGLPLTAGSQVGPEVLAGGLIAQLPARLSDDLLSRFGAPDPKKVRDMVSLAVRRSKEAAKVKVSRKLASLLKAANHDVACSASTLRRALTDFRTDAVGWMLYEPYDFVGHYRGAESKQPTVGDLLEQLVRLYGPRLHCGEMLYGVRGQSSGVRLFATAGGRKAVLAAAARFKHGEHSGLRGFYSRAIYERSPMGKCGRKFGELAAQVVGIVTLADMGLLGIDPLSVREIAWTIDYREYHHSLELTKRSIINLSEKQWLRTPAQGDELYSRMPVASGSRLLAETSRFLIHDPITQSEIDDAVSTNLT